MCCCVLTHIAALVLQTYLTVTSLVHRTRFVQHCCRGNTVAAAYFASGTCLYQHFAVVCTAGMRILCSAVCACMQRDRSRLVVGVHGLRPSQCARCHRAILTILSFSCAMGLMKLHLHSSYAHGAPELVCACSPSLCDCTLCCGRTTCSICSAPFTVTCTQEEVNGTITRWLRMHTEPSRKHVGTVLRLRPTERWTVRGACPRFVLKSYSFSRRP